MPVNLAIGKKEGLGKLRTRRPSVRISNLRTRSQLQPKNDTTISMSVDQSGKIAVEESEEVAAFQTRQVSTTSALVNPSGISIGIICESTTENQEAVDGRTNLSSETTVTSDLNVMVPFHPKLHKKTTSKSAVSAFRKSLSFLTLHQFERLCCLNIKSNQQILNITLRQLLTLKLNDEQLQLLLSLVQTECSREINTLEAFEEGIQSIRSLKEEWEEMDRDNDGDDKPLVIDETISNFIEENKFVKTNDIERSLDDIEECFSVIRNVKIPQSRATITEVKSELTEIIAELSAKEERILRELEKKKQQNITLKADVLPIPDSNEEPVTTTTASIRQKLQPTVLIKKMSIPLRMQGSNVDADSTTTNIDPDGKSLNGDLHRRDEKYRTEHIQRKTKRRHVPVANVVKAATKTANISDEHSKAFTSDISDNTAEIKNRTSVCNKATVSKPKAGNELEQEPKSASPESPEFVTVKKASNDLNMSSILLNNQISVNKQKSYDRRLSLNVRSMPLNKLNTGDRNKELLNQPHCSYYNSTLKEISEDSSARLPAQRCIVFGSKQRDAQTSEDYDVADSVVTIVTTPLSPISIGSVSSLNPKANLSDYKPAAEIDGHISCSGIIYLLREIDIPEVTANKPDALDLLLRTNTSDPRLIKYLKKSTIAVHTSMASSAISKVIQNDPRRSSSIYNSDSYSPQRQQESQQKPNMLLYGCLQRSPWYQSLMSTMKIQINHTISVLVRAINNFQKIRREDPYAVFDIFKLYCAGELLEILENLGLFVNVSGVISEKKNMSSYTGRSYGCSSVVNATYSFIQPVEPSNLTVQHQRQQMHSFTAPPSPFQSPASFISCYIDAPQVALDKPQQSQLSMGSPASSLSPPRPPSTTFRKRSAPPRRHCGLKVPYKPGVPPGRASVSPVKRQIECVDSEEECWDSDETPVSDTPATVPRSPSFGNDYDHTDRELLRSDRLREKRSHNYRKPFRDRTRKRRY